MTNNQIKHGEAEDFNRYLDSLNRRHRADFIKWLAFECGVGRHVVYSWCYMCSRIPEPAKAIIEKGADQRVFRPIICFD